MLNIQQISVLNETNNLDTIHHIAIQVKNIKRAVLWYLKNFDCSLNYADRSWASLHFKNIDLALVLPEQHPAHIAFEKNPVGKKKPYNKHRDGVCYVYKEDTDSNVIEYLKKEKP